jgi:hypothetical protein
LARVLQSDQRNFQVACVAEEVHHAHQFAVGDGAVSAQKNALLAIMGGVLIEDGPQRFAGAQDRRRL